MRMRNGLGIPEVAEVDAVHQQVIVLLRVAAEFQLGVDARQPGPQLGEDLRRVHHREPQGFPAGRDPRREPPR